MHLADSPGKGPGGLLPAAILVFIFLLCPPPAAGRTRYRVARFVEKNGLVHMDVSFPNLMTSKLRRKLKSGFVQTILLRAVVREQGTRKAVHFTISTATLVYDLWNETYEVTVVQPHRTLRLSTKNADKAVSWISSSHSLAVVRFSALKPGLYYYVDADVLYNPLSKALLRKVRRWLRSPRDAVSGLVAGRSFFGLSLSFFVNQKISPAERRIRFRTQNFYRPPKEKTGGSGR